MFLNCTIEYGLDISSDQSYEGTIDNISESGFCLFTDRLLSEGQEITIRSLIYLPSQTATVCWVEPVDNWYKVGLRFN